MAEKERSFGNWVGNVAKAPGRLLYSGGLLVSDVVNTTTGFCQDILSCVKSTKDKIIDCFSPEKKRYQKILNVPVAAGIGLAGALETVVKPVVNGVTNTGRTVINATTNTLKSTFGSVFSAKPVSDFSFNTVKTKKGIVNIDTTKRVMDVNKPWTINRGKWSKNSKKDAGKVAATAAVAGAATAAVGAKEIADLKKSFEDKIEQINAKFSKQIEEALAANKKLSEANSKLTEENKKLKEEIEKLKKGDTPKKVDDGPKPEKKVEGDGDKKGESKGKEGDGKSEKTEGKAEGKKEEKKADRGSLSVDGLAESGSTTRKLLDFARKNHPELKITFQDDKSTGHVDLSDDTITVGTDMPKNEKMIAIANEKKDIVTQTRHVLGHELAHIVLFDNKDSKNIKGFKDFAQNIINSKGAPLTRIASMDQYDSKESKAKEDICELISLYARDNGDFNKYMENLQSGVEGLAQISADDCEKIKAFCKGIIEEISDK